MSYTTITQQDLDAVQVQKTNLQTPLRQARAIVTNATSLESLRDIFATLNANVETVKSASDAATTAIGTLQGIDTDTAASISTILGQITDATSAIDTLISADVSQEQIDSVQDQAVQDILTSIGNLNIAGQISDAITALNMNDYAKIADMGVAFATYTTTADLNTMLNDYVEGSALTTTLADYALTSALSDFVTDTSLATTLEGYTTDAELSDIDTRLSAIEDQTGTLTDGNAISGTDTKRDYQYLGTTGATFYLQDVEALQSLKRFTIHNPNMQSISFAGTLALFSYLGVDISGTYSTDINIIDFTWNPGSQRFEL